MNQSLSFDDVLIVPKFSLVRSRKEVELKQAFMQYNLDLPIISANMDTITGYAMSNAMAEAGGVGALHRFCTVDENVEMFKKCHTRKPLISLGLGEGELLRAEVLFDHGARNFVIDVAHGASIATVEQYDALRDLLGNGASIMVGNFATAEGIIQFNGRSRSNKKPNAYKVGIGGGSMCTTRIVTGCGMPTLQSVIDCARTKLCIVADGGIKNSGDIAKALAAGADAVMIGSILSGTDETPGETLKVLKGQFGTRELAECEKKWSDEQILQNAYALRGNLGTNTIGLVKKYRGSASAESYGVQGKLAAHRSAEGEATFVDSKGPAKNVLEQLAGGLRSALSYVDAFDLREFRQNVEFQQITAAGMSESKPHGVRK